MSTSLESVDQVVERLHQPGLRVGLGGSINAGHPMALVRGIIRHQLSGLNVVTGMTGGLDVDMLVAAGCVDTLVSSYIGAEDLAPTGPAFRRALRDGTLRHHDTDEAVHLAGLNAAAKSLPFGMWTAALGTSIPELNPGVTEEVDARSGRAYLRVEPIEVDIALLWAPTADQDGNIEVWDADLGDPALAAAAAVRVVQVEELVSTSELLSRGRVSEWVADVLVVAPGGTHPFASNTMAADRRWLTEYVQSFTRGQSNDFIDHWLRRPEDEASYRGRIDDDQWEELVTS